MEHHSNVNALLVTQAEADQGVGVWNILKDEHGDCSIVDGSGANHGDSMCLSEALATAEMLAVQFDVRRLTEGGLPQEDAEEIERTMGDMIGGVLHYGPTHNGPVFTVSEATDYIRRRLDPPEACVVTLSIREHDAVLAGLRLLTKAFDNDWIDRDDSDIGAILTSSALHPGLSVDQIHDLADALMAGARDPR